MLPNCYQSANALAGMAAEALSIDQLGQHTPRKHSHDKLHSNGRANEGPHIQHPHNNTKHSSLSSLSKDQDGTEESDDGQDADTDDADEDEKDGSDKKAVLAPSDCDNPDQAGPTFSMGRGLDGSTRNLDSSHGGSSHRGNESSNLQVDANGLGQDADDDEEIYNAVDDISESDGEDPGIEEEAFMLSDYDMFGDGLGPYDPNQYAGDVAYFDEQLRLLSYSHRAEVMESKPSTPAFHAIARMPSPPPPTPTTATRRVHFETSTLGADMPDTCGQSLTRDDVYSDEKSEHSSVSGTDIETDGETTDEEGIPSNVVKSPRNLLHQPSWAEEPLFPNPARRKHSERVPKVNRPHGPLCGEWTHDPQRIYSQADKTRAVILTSPLTGPPDRLGDHQVTACLAPPPRRNNLTQSRPSITEGVTIPDPTLCTGTNSNMVGMMENLLGEEIPTFQPPPVLSDFLPADDVVDELDFIEPNSDHESTDLETGLDITDFIEFPDDDSEPDSSLASLKPSEKGTSQQVGGLQGSFELTAPLITPASSQSNSPPSMHEALAKDKTSSAALSHGMPPSQSRPPLRRPRSGLALTKPIASGNNTPAKPDRKRKLSDSISQPELHPMFKRRR